MLWRSFIIVTVLCLSACGFKPLYGSSQHNSLSDTLAAVEIPEARNRTEQIFLVHLSDLLNPGNISAPPQYRINVTLNQSSSPLAIQKDRTITRYKTIITAHYTLTDIATGKVIEENSLRRDGGYDRVESDYATYVSETQTVKHILHELAEDFKLRLTLTLL